MEQILGEAAKWYIRREIQLVVDNGVSDAVVKWDEKQVQKRKEAARRKRDAQRRGLENLYDNY